MYADDVKLYNTSTNNSLLIQDLAAILKWSHDWLLPLNIKKCNVLYIGKHNPKFTYSIGGVQLEKKDYCQDLGVIISSDLSWSQHMIRVVKKANSVLYLLSKAFCKPSYSTFVKLYKSFVRPILEFANAVWTPILQRDLLLLESVQRRATRVPFGRTRPQYSERLSLMNLTSLTQRRLRGDLIVTFQALTNQLSPIRHVKSSSDERLCWR